MKTYFSSGCLGDIIYSLPSVKALGAGRYYYDNRRWTAPLLSKVRNILPLLEAQPYITGVSQHNGELIDHDFSTFRFGGLRYGEPIIHRQARWVRAKVDLSSPWLTVTPSSQAEIVIARCARWQGFIFPWKELVRQLGSRMIFVGLRAEYESFTMEFGPVAYFPTQDLLHAAAVIAGADLFIGSQSSPLAIAEGLHKRTIVEVCPWAPDCFNFRNGNIHVTGSNLAFSINGTNFEHHMILKNVCKDKADLINRAESTRRDMFNRHLLTEQAKIHY